MCRTDVLDSRSGEWTMFEAIKNILVSLTEEGRNESTTPLPFALFWPRRRVRTSQSMQHHFDSSFRAPWSAGWRQGWLRKKTAGWQLWLTVLLLRRSEKRGCRGYHVQSRFLICHMPTFA